VHREAVFAATKVIRAKPSAYFLQQNRQQLIDLDARLLHGVAIAQRDRIFQLGSFFTEGIKIDCDSERRAGFILTTVAPADGTRVIIKTAM